MITSERDGEIIDKSLVKKIIGLFESMGMGSLDVYNSDFEAPLLASTREYYMRKREDWILNDSMPDYMMKAETALNDERNRVSEYLNQSSEKKLMRVVEEELLEKVEIEVLEKECSGCRFLLANDKSEDLRRMFRLFSRLENGLNPMVAIAESFITGLGRDIPLFQMITSERDGEIIDKALVKNIIEFFQSMGMGSLDAYNADLEAPLLASTREYYV